MERLEAESTIHPQGLMPVILSVAFVLMSSVPISTVYSEIRLEYAAASPWLLDLVTVAPNLMHMLAVALSGVLHKALRPRVLLLTALATMLATGLLPVVYGGIFALIISRGLVGFCCGTLAPIVTIMATSRYQGIKRNRVMGYRSAAQAFGSMSMMLMTMALARFGWRYAFFIYMMALLPLLAAIKYMARDEILPHEVSGGEPGVRMRSGDSLVKAGRIAFYSVCSFVYMICLNTLAPNLSAFIIESGLGAGTLSGIGMCAYMLGSFFSGIAYNKIAVRCGRLTVFAGMALTAAGIAVIAVARAFMPVVVGCILQGVGAAVFASSSILEASSGIEGGAKSRIILIILISTGIGSFLSPFLMDFGTQLFWGSSLMRGRYMIGAVSLSLFSMITLLYSLTHQRRG